MSFLLGRKDTNSAPLTINAGIPGDPLVAWDAVGVDDVRFQSAVPEPSSLALTGIAVLAGLGLYARRRFRL